MILIAIMNFLTYFPSNFGRYTIPVYCFAMKFLILMLVLTISAQPLQAGFCSMDMASDQESSHHMEASANNDHDCCDSDDSNSQEGCDGEMDCGFCFVSVSALHHTIKINPAWVHQYSRGFLSNVVYPSHSSPPFRPPIS